MPTLVAVSLVARRGSRDFIGLLSLSVALTLAFFLTRTWLAETNVVVVLAPVLVLAALGRLDRRLYTALWILPFCSTLLYLWPLKLLWAVAPAVAARAAVWTEQSGGLVLAAQVALVVIWQIVGWWIVVTCLRRRPMAAGERPDTAYATGPTGGAGQAGAGPREALP